jgi:hypothetical protein
MNNNFEDCFSDYSAFMVTENEQTSDAIRFSEVALILAVLEKLDHNS